MSLPTPPPSSDPAQWPVVECLPTDIFLGVFDFDCTPSLTAEQKGWPAAGGEPTDAPGGLERPSPPRS